MKDLTKIIMIKPHLTPNILSRALSGKWTTKVAVNLIKTRLKSSRTLRQMCFSIHRFWRLINLHQGNADLLSNQFVFNSTLSTEHFPVPINPVVHFRYGKLSFVKKSLDLLLQLKICKYIKSFDRG